MTLSNPRTIASLIVLSLLGPFALHGQPNRSGLYAVHIPRQGVTNPGALDPPTPGIQTIAVCFQNERLIGGGVLKFTIETLKRYEKELRRELRFSCESEDAITITFREYPARQLPNDALGAARRSGDRILPQIEIFRASVRRLIGVVPPGIEGRAFGKIATHELYHYLRQETGHTAGVNGEFFTPQDLIYGLE